MKRLVVALGLTLVLILIGTSLAFARGAYRQHSDLVLGAQIYDKWFGVLDRPAPEADMPLWSRQSGNTRSGPDTWRCSECHGWDYRGAQGAYASGSHKTGFPGLLDLVPDLSEEEIISHLQGSKDPAHDFSKYLDVTDLHRVAMFLKQGLIDDELYIDSSSLNVVKGNLEHGRGLFADTCAKCHGVQGLKIIFRTEGVDETLGDVALRDPFRFLHRTRFGVAGTEMPVGYELGWSPADGRDVLAFVQTLPAGGKHVTPAPGVESAGPTEGPAANPQLGIFYGLLAILGSVGSMLLLVGVFVLIGFVVVLALRRKN